MGMENVGLHMSTAMFFESVPDEYVDVNLDKWEFDEYERVVPIIIPRNYLNLYNSVLHKAGACRNCRKG